MNDMKSHELKAPENPQADRNETTPATAEESTVKAGGNTAPLLEHLMALRQVFVVSAIAVVVSFSLFITWRSNL